MYPGLHILRVWNIVAAGIPGFMALFLPKVAADRVWQGQVAPSDATRMLGAYWLTVSIVSIVAGSSESVMCTMGLVQLIYKLLYLLVVAFPNILRNKHVNWKEVLLFLFNVIVLLPLTLPWSRLNSILYAIGAG